MTLPLHPQTPLRRERLRAGLSQVSLAVRAGCSLSTVSLVERGGFLSPDMAARLARALAVPADDLAAVAAALPRTSQSNPGREPTPGAAPASPLT